MSYGAEAERALGPSQLPLSLSNEFEDLPLALASRGKNMLLAHAAVGRKGTCNHPIERRMQGLLGLWMERD